MSDDIRLLGIESVKPYTLLGSTDLYTVEPPEMLIEDAQPAGTITGLTAAPGVGKTWFALEMARAVATGTKFLEAFQARQGMVLFVGSDSSKEDYARQWRRLTLREWQSYVPLGEGHHDVDNPLESNVHFLIQSDFMLDNIDTIRRLVVTANALEWGPETEHVVGFEPSAEGDLQIPITELRRRRGAVLVIFDTWSKLTSVEQNSNTFTESVFRNVRFFSRLTGAACLILHHNAAKSEHNDGEGWRGATAGPGALDNQIQLNRTEKEKYLIRAEYKKFRGITPEPFYYAMNVSDEDSASLAFKQPSEVEVTGVEDELVDAIVGLLRGQRGQQLTKSEIATALHPKFTFLFPDADKFERAIYARISNEKRRLKPRILQEGGGNRGRRAAYMAADFEETPE